MSVSWNGRRFHKPSCLLRFRVKSFALSCEIRCYYPASAHQAPIRIAPALKPFQAIVVKNGLPYRNCCSCIAKAAARALSVDKERIVTIVMARLFRISNGSSNSRIRLWQSCIHLQGVQRRQEADLFRPSGLSGGLWRAGAFIGGLFEPGGRFARGRWLSGHAESLPVEKLA